MQDKANLEWLGYCHFHSGEHKKALDAYTELLNLGDPDGPDPLYHTYSAACHFYLGNYKEAETEAHKVCERIPYFTHRAPRGSCRLMHWHVLRVPPTTDVRQGLAQLTARVGLGGAVCLYACVR